MITLAIIAKYECRFQQLVLEAAPFVEEIVVVADTEAEAGVLNFMPTLGIKYVPCSERTDFSVIRNMAVAAATEPWVFHLDTDEEYPLSGWLLLRHLLPRLDSSVDVVALPRNNHVAGGDNVGWPDWQPKLHRRHLRWFLPQHECLEGVKNMYFLPAQQTVAMQHWHRGRSAHVDAARAAYYERTGAVPSCQPCAIK